MSGVVTAIVCLPAFLTLVWFFEVVAGCFALSKGKASAVAALGSLSHRTAVLIPAHDEARGLLLTIQDMQAQLGPSDRILVVADNCTDDTAAIAEEAGVEVIVRADLSQRGKGYALEFGVQHLSFDPPDVVVIMDADCRLGQNALLHLSRNSMISGRPSQAIYLMLAPEESRSDKGVSLFTWRVRNWVRPLGLKLFGLPTQLFGTGMAFPFSLLVGRDLGNSRLAEDCALGVALASIGSPPLLVSEAKVYSHFPISQAGNASQRQRWEKGHLDNILDLVPGALVESLRSRRLGLLALALDMAVPPLSLLVLTAILCIALGGLAFVLGASATAMFISLLSVVFVVFGTVLAWNAVGRDVLPLRELLRLPLHVIRKSGFYYGIASGKASSSWIRTDRK
jgi:cellulose synthase/poly-beta-1,6-N-acetylglucosamine synthase-like glycosyltransferase